MNKKKAQVDEIFAYFGGPTRLAEQLGVRQSAASNWHLRGIPAKQAIEIERLSDGRFRAVDLCCSH